MQERKAAPVTAEQAHLAEFMRNTESTANLIPSNSAGMAILKLSEQYLGSPADPEKLAGLQKECIEALSSISEKEPVKQIEIDFIKNKMQEQKNQWDRVTLYLPKTKTADGSLGREKEDFVQYTFPLDEVVPLVWKALNDDSQFVYADAGDQKREIKQIEQDKKDRIELFFTCLNRMRTEGVCHHGNRNDLVFILNGICKDINLIEDGRSAVLSILKESLLKKYQEAKPTPELHAALLSWIEDNDAKAITKLVDPEGSILKSIHALFVKHGVDPLDETAKTIINHAFSYVEFSCDPKSLFYKVQSVLNLPEFKDETINQSLEHVKSLIRKNFPLENKEDQLAVNRYWFVAKVYKSFLEARDFLSFSGGLIDEFETLFQSAELYLKNFSEKGSPSLSESFIQTAEKLNIEIQKSKKSILFEKIRDFFALWFEAELNLDPALNRRLYSTLLNHDVREKIILKDEDLLKLLSESKLSPGDVEVTPYVINRIFLHAILVSPDQWTKKFNQELRRILDFVEKNFNQENVGVAAELLKSSYPDELRNQMRYLLKTTEEHKEEIIRPARMILMPEFCKTIEELLSLPVNYRSSIWTEYYNIYRLKWNKMLHEYPLYEYVHTIVPIQARVDFWVDLKLKKPELFSNMAIHHLRHIFSNIPKEGQLKVVGLFSKIKFSGWKYVFDVCQFFSEDLQRSREGFMDLLKHLDPGCIYAHLQTESRLIIGYLQNEDHQFIFFDIVINLGISFSQLYEINYDHDYHFQCALREYFLKLSKDERFTILKGLDLKALRRMLSYDFLLQERPGYFQQDELRFFCNRLLTLEFKQPQAQSIIDTVKALHPIVYTTFLSFLDRDYLFEIARSDDFNKVDEFLNLFSWSPDLQESVLERMDPHLPDKKVSYSPMFLKSSSNQEELKDEEKKEIDKFSRINERYRLAEKGRSKFPGLFLYRLKMLFDYLGDLPDKRFQIEIDFSDIREIVDIFQKFPEKLRGKMFINLLTHIDPEVVFRTLCNEMDDFLLLYVDNMHDFIYQLYDHLRHSGISFLKLYDGFQGNYLGRKRLEEYFFELLPMDRFEILKEFDLKELTQFLKAQVSAKTLFFDALQSLPVTFRLNFLNSVDRRHLLEVSRLDDIEEFLNLFEPFERGLVLEQINSCRLNKFLGICVDDFKPEEKKFEGQSSSEQVSEVIKFFKKREQDQREAKKDREEYPGLFQSRLSGRSEKSRENMEPVSERKAGKN